METLKDELTHKTRDKIIELFGPESALAQAMEDDAFFDKLGDLIAWLWGQIMLSQPRPEPKYPKSEAGYPGPYTWVRYTKQYKWDAKDSPFAKKLWSAMSNYEKR